MKREELIAKGEKQLNYIKQKVEQSNTEEAKKNWAMRGSANLEMLDYILDEAYENFGNYFGFFEKYI